MQRRFTITDCDVSNNVIGIHATGDDLDLSIIRTKITENDVGISTEAIEPIIAAIKSKPQNEQPKWLAMLADAVSGTAAGVTVEVLKKQLGL